MHVISCADLSETQRALVDINQRYDVIGERLADRRGETQETLSKVSTPLIYRFMWPIHTDCVSSGNWLSLFSWELPLEGGNLGPRKIFWQQNGCLNSLAAIPCASGMSLQGDSCFQQSS